MNYLWTDEAEQFRHKTLEKDISTDVCIIGGGIAGIMCAAKLTELGIDNVVLESKQIGRGITKGTTAVLTAQHDTLYKDIIKKYGLEKATQYYNANISALHRIEEKAKTVECDFEKMPSIMYSVGGNDGLRDEALALKYLGVKARYTTSPELPFRVADAIEYEDAAQFHPLRFLNGVAAGLNIYENTFVRKLEGTTAFTDKGKVKAKKVIVATHFPFINRYGLYFMKMYQKRSYVIAYSGAPNFNCTAEDADNGFYFRNYKDLLLIGGGDHRTGKQGGGYRAVENFAKRWFPKAKEQYRWSNQDCVTLDGIPYIGRYSPSMPNVYVATGFNLWGMTTSVAAAEILADMITGKKNVNAPVFAPDRNMLCAKLFENMGITVADMLFPTTKRCPHLGCALRKNKAEHSWDCPCHGSRFDKKGKLIENPAMRDADV